VSRNPSSASHDRIAALQTETLCEAFQATAAERPAQVAHRTLDGSVEFTYSEFAERIRALATGLHSIGVRRGDTVALMLANRPEFALVDTAAMHLGAIAFSVYNTLSAEQIGYLFRNAANRVVITERMMLPRVLAARTPQIEHVVLVDGEAPGTITLAELAQRPSRGFRFEEAWRDVQPTDVVTLIYTSGTTGPPKAVQLTHANVMFEARAFAEAMPVPMGGRGISYLPSAHVGDRVLVHYCGSMCYATTITSIPDYRQIGVALASVRPTSFGAVPRVWEKLKAGIEAAGIRAPALAPEPVKAAIRAKLGFDQCDWSVSSAAPASPEVLQFFTDLGMPLNEAWGMSELSCFATVNPPGDVRAGTVGRALPGVELRVLEDGELLVRAPLVMKGYRDDPERTAEALDADGWLHTGDVARIDGDGYVTIVDRKKEIIINSAGKNMSPANIEHRLRASSPLIAHAVCIGDRRPYNVALLALDPEMSARWAAERGLSAAQLELLCRHDDLRSAIQSAVESANAGLSRVEQIKRFAIVGADWQPGSDELTPTSKIKRRPIHEKYRAEIEALYT
jgi:long-subunit acyl-CoA synthetase (AMP-forming)